MADTPIDILDLALAVDNGDPITITAKGHDITLKKRYTGDEVHELISMFSPANMDTTYEEHLTKTLEIMSTSAQSQREKFIAELLQLTEVEVAKVIVSLGQIAGLRGKDGVFLTT